MSRISNGSGTGMDRKIKARQELLIRCRKQFLAIYGGNPMPAALRELVQELSCYILNPPKMRVRKQVECHHHQIFNAATAAYAGEGRCQALNEAAANGAMVQIPLRDLMAMRNKINEMSNICRNLDVEFEP